MGHPAPGGLHPTSAARRWGTRLVTIGGFRALLSWLGIRARIWSGFQPSFLLAHQTLGFTLGWDRAGLRP
jgi:hypothetical protein